MVIVAWYDSGRHTEPALCVPFLLPRCCEDVVPDGSEQQIEDSTVQVAIGGSVAGNVYVGGTPTPEPPPTPEQRRMLRLRRDELTRKANYLRAELTPTTPAEVWQQLSDLLAEIEKLNRSLARGNGKLNIERLRNLAADDQAVYIGTMVLDIQAQLHELLSHYHQDRQRITYLLIGFGVALMLIGVWIVLHEVAG